MFQIHFYLSTLLFFTEISNNFPLENSRLMTHISFKCTRCHSQGSWGKLLKVALGSDTQFMWPIWLVHRGQSGGFKGTFFTCVWRYICNKKECNKTVYWGGFPSFIIAHIYSFFMAHSSHFSLPRTVLYIHTYFIVYLTCPNQVWNRNVYRAPSLLKYPKAPIF